jgi:hypothetical protein
METTNRVVTDKVRFSFVHIFTPHKFNEGGKEQYSIMMLIPKTDKKNIAKFVSVADHIKSTPEALKKWGGKVPSTVKAFLNDGDDVADKYPECAGCYYINAKNTLQPGIVDVNRQAILAESEVYSGCYGRVSCTLFPFNNVQKGISVSLNNVQKLEDGEPLSAVQPSAEDDFEAFTDDPLDF